MLFLLTALIFLVWLRYYHHGRLSLAIVEGWTLFAVFAYGYTELASSRSSITYPTWLIGWATFTTGLVFLATIRFITAKDMGNRFIELGQKVLAIRHNIEIFLLICLFLVVLLIGGLRFPPNNYDSMTYHLARVEHWVTNQNINFYPTHITRQLYMQPLAEVLILQFRVLQNSERVDFIVQWFALIACLAGGWYLASTTNVNRAAPLTLLLVVTVPMAILQANSTQNDLLAASWMMAAAIHTQRCIQKPSLKRYLWLGLTIGLGLLTKGTLYFLILPIPIIIAGNWLINLTQRTTTLKEVTKQAGLAGLAVSLALLINIPFYWRNIQLTHHPIGATPEEMPYLIEMRPVFAVANLIKNTSMQLQLPFPTGNSAIAQTVVKFVQDIIGIDDINHPAIDYNINDQNEYGYWLNSQFNSEDIAGSPLHAVLFVFSVGWFLVNRKKHPHWLLVLIPVLGFMFAFTCIKWQPWITRLQLPAVVVGMPLAAVFLAKLQPFKQGLVIGGLVLSGIVIMVTNSSKNIAADYDYSNRENARELHQVIDAIITANAAQPLQTIGIVAGHGNFWEYPLLYRLNTETYPTPKVISLSVKNVSQQFTPATITTPDMIVCYACDAALTSQLTSTHREVMNNSPEVSLWVANDENTVLPLLFH